MFTTPCFVKIEDAQERADLIKWLEGIGYTFNVCHKNAYEVAISPHSTTKVIKVERRAESSFIDALESTDTGIDCGTNIDLFKAIAALRDDSDTMQFFRITDLSTGNIVDKCVRLTYGKRVSKKRFNLNRCHDYLIKKLSPQELIEYFKTLKK